MAAQITRPIPENLSFEAALAWTQTLLDRRLDGELSDADWQQSLTDLVSSENGARGFFVVYLSDPRSLTESTSNAVLAALQTAPNIVSPLLIKNLAMSTAMAITHQRNQNSALESGSHRVQARSRILIEQLPLPQLQQEAIVLAESLTTGSGTYQAFLERWGYDAQQRQAIRLVLSQTGLV